ncbi:MAG: hypothetical protein GXX85_05550 [Ignavibacteria bacterium]|nr:hypothetical protein [Ignavibacteria bacterium]
MSQNYLYTDEFIDLTENTVKFKNYFVPFKKERELKLKEIEKITLLQPNIWNGRYRLNGTGNFKDWFPADLRRSSREIIYRVKIKNKWWRVCFTVSDSNKLTSILKQLSLL